MNNGTFTAIGPFSSKTLWTKNKAMHLKRAMFWFDFCCLETLNKRDLGKENMGFGLTLPDQPIIEGDQTRNLKQKPWRNTARGLTLLLAHAKLPFLHSLGPPAAPSRLGLLHQVTMKTVLCRHVHRPIWSGKSLHQDSLLRWFYTLSSWQYI